MLREQSMDTDTYSTAIAQVSAAPRALKNSNNQTQCRFPTHMEMYHRLRETLSMETMIRP